MFCPNANSYRRFQTNSYAPLAATWGVDNRTVSLRVPGSPANSQHIEHHICGVDANPYLAAAAILAGIHCGIREQRDPGAPVEGNGYAQVNALLPTDWLTTLRALEGLDWAQEAFGSEFLGVYLAVKRAEYRQFMGEWASRIGVCICTRHKRIVVSGQVRSPQRGEVRVSTFFHVAVVKLRIKVVHSRLTLMSL